MELPRTLLRDAEEFAQALVVVFISGPGPRVPERLALYNQQTVEVEQRIIEQYLSLQGDYLFDRCRVAFFGACADFREQLFIFLQFPQVLVALGVFMGISLGQVADSELESLEVNVSQTFGGR